MKKMLLLSCFFFIKVHSQLKEIDTLKVEKLEEIVLDNKKERVKQVNPDKIHYSSDLIDKSINILGEANPIKLMQLNAGVQATAEGQSGFIVRGGNQSMNLFYLDNIYLHNTSHIGGLFPALNANYIKSIDFYKGGFSAEDGGRLSSVTKINTKKNLGDNHFQSNIGLLSAKVTSAFTLKKLNTSVLISGRRTFLELLNAIVGNENSLLGEGRSYYFYDYLIRVETDLNSKNRIVFTNFSSKDNYKNENDSGDLKFFWQNNLAGINWYYRPSFLFKNHLVVSNSQFKLENSSENFPYSYSFKSKYQVKSIRNTSTLTKDKYQISGGIHFQQIQNTPKNVVLTLLEDTQREIDNNEYDIEDLSVFVNHLWKISEKLKINTGLRYTNYHLKNNSTHKHSYLEPRLNINYKFIGNHGIKFSFQSVKQYLHQARVSTLSLPLDYFIPANKQIGFQENQQFSIGYFFKRGVFNGNVNIYNKKINNYTEFKSGALNNLFKSDLYEDIVRGTLNSSGAEFHLEAEYKGFNGILNYTYSNTNARFKDINKGVSFPTTFNRPHNFNTTLSYILNKKWSLSGLFLFTSGQHYTPIKDLRIVNEFVVLNFGSKNSARFPSYHRLDVGADYILKEKKGYKSSLNFTIYNLYNNQNPFYINNQIDGSISEREFTISSTFENLFPIIPALSWSLKF